MRNANYDGCEKNGIKYPAEMRNLPPLHRIYYKAIGESRSDKLYYFNANHLGSGSLITDGNGRTYQTLAYEPWGGQVVDIKHYSDIYDEPYRFGGKIKDEESGLNYFEARYYWDDGSFPISTDPHWYNRLHLSPYVWCANNPIMRVDVDGKDDYFNEDGTFSHRTKTGSNIYINNTLLGKYEFNSKNAYALAKIGVFYAKKMGLNVAMLKNHKFSVANMEQDVNWYAGKSLYNDGVVGGVDDIMNCDDINMKITFSLKDGFVSELLNDIDNMKSINIKIVTINH